MTFRWQILSILLFCAAAQAYEYGPDPRYTGAPGDNKTACIASGCHVGTVNSNTAGSVKILLPGAATTYVPGQAMTIQVLITDASKKAYGFQLTARLASNTSAGQAGDFAAGSDGYTQVLCDDGSLHDDGAGHRKPCGSFPVQFIEHTLKGFDASISTKGSFTYTFTWTPPASGAGNVILYAAGNAGNDTLSTPTGTDVYTSNINLTPTSAVGTTTTLASSVNPSPFGQNFTLTATVSPSTATGTVTFNDGATVLGSATLSAGTATLIESACLSAGTHSITASYSGDSTNAASTSSPLQETINQGTTAPVLKYTGVVPLYSSSNNIQSGSWISLYGCNLYNPPPPPAPGYLVWNSDFPRSLGGVNVTIDNTAAYLWYVSPTQVNVQVPDDTFLGPVSVSLTTTANGTSNAVTATLAKIAPSLLLFDVTHAVGVIPTPSGTGAYGGGTYDLLGPVGSPFGFATRPVKKGETVELFGVGFGPTQLPVPAGYPLSAPSGITSPITCTVGGVSAPIGAAIIFAGEYQINVTIPQGAPSGDQPIVVTVGGVQPSQPVVLSVQ